MSSKLVLVLNCGSSSLKFAIINPENGEEFLSGLAECFNLPEARLKWKMDGQKHEAALGAGAAHSEALNFIVNTILAENQNFHNKSQQLVIVLFTVARNLLNLSSLLTKSSKVLRRLFHLPHYITQLTLLVLKKRVKPSLI